MNGIVAGQSEDEQHPISHLRFNGGVAGTTQIWTGKSWRNELPQNLAQQDPRPTEQAIPAHVSIDWWDFKVNPVPNVAAPGP